MASNPEPTGIDVARVRADTPGLATLCDDGRSLLHLNAAGAALPPKQVTCAVVTHTRLEAAIGGYEAAARAAANPANDVYALLARLVNARSPNDIAVVDSATGGWVSLVYSLPWREGDVIVTSEAEYAANYVAFLQLQRRHHLGPIVVVPSTPLLGSPPPATEDVAALPRDPCEGRGALDVRALERLLRQHGDAVALVAVSHIPTNGGLVNPARGIGDAVAAHNAVPGRTRSAFYLLDACQTAGQIPIDVQVLRCHGLTATSRKYLRGPRGVGFLYVDARCLCTADTDKCTVGGAQLPRLAEPITIDHFAAPWLAGAQRYRIRNDARQFERWESSHANRVGLAAAVRYYLDTANPAAAWQRVQWLADRLRRGLLALRDDTSGRDAQLCAVHDIGAVQCGIVTFSVFRAPSNSRSWGTAPTPVSPQVVQKALAGVGVATTVSLAGSTRLDMERRLPAVIGPARAGGVVRASLHYYHSAADVDTAVARIAAVARALAAGKRVPASRL